MKKLLFTCIISLIGYSLLYSQSISEKMIEHIKASTVYIEIKHNSPFFEKENATSGTGFFISQHGYIVTNYHVIRPLIFYYNISYPSATTEIRVIKNSGTKTHQSFSANVIAADKENDLAILKILDTIKTPYIKIDTLKKLIESMPVWTFGYPFGEAFSVIQRGPEATITKGAITALRHDDMGKFTSIQMDAVVNPGNSGGPLINEKGELIGIVNIGGGTTRMNFAVPAHYLNKLVKNIPLDKALNDSAVITISSSPSGASVFVNWESKGVTPSKEINVKPGWHTVCIMMQGYETWMEDRSIIKSENINIQLKPLKEISLCPGEIDKKKNDKVLSDLKWKENLYQTADTGIILLKEDFNNTEIFEEWRQSSGGTYKRTWFLQDGILHQYVNDAMLHAIYLGDSTWDNYSMRAKVKITGEDGDSRAGLIFRETKDGFYLFRIHKESDKVQLAYHCKNPFGWNILLEKELDIDITDKWYSLTAYAQDNTIICFLDSICIFNTNAKYSEQGRIGFYSVQSQPSFDSLIVTRNTLNTSNLSGKQGQTGIIDQQNDALLSFWFSDYFTLKSTWWYQYSNESKLQSPWFFSDAGCAQLKDDEETRSIEFTKYDLANFSINLILSLGKGSDSSIFKIFFRKNEDNYLTLNFSKKGNKAELIEKQGSNIKTLKKIALKNSLFNKSSIISLTIHNGSIICKISNDNIMEYKSKSLSINKGKFGFTTSQLPAVLHELRVYSVNKKQLAEISK